MLCTNDNGAESPSLIKPDRIFPQDEVISAAQLHRNVQFGAYRATLPVQTLNVALRIMGISRAWHSPLLSILRGAAHNFPNLIQKILEILVVVNSPDYIFKRTGDFSTLSFSCPFQAR